MASYKKTIIFISLIVAVAIGVFGWVMSSKYNTIKENWKISTANEKAYAARLDSIVNNNRVFQVTIDQLKYANDSISKRLLSSAHEMKIKDKNIQELQYLYSNFKKTDTISLVDTIFIDRFVFDTIIGDDWMHTHLHMENPGIITTETCVTSRKDVVVHSSKETINPPHKFIVFRWFQKKHRVVKVDVREENPHIQSEDNVFIRVIN